jgi:DNA-binding protein H-NS
VLPLGLENETKNCVQQHLQAVEREYVIAYMDAAESSMRVPPMKKIELENMSIDDLWALHEKVSRILSARIASEKHELEKRLAYLNRGTDVIMQGAELTPSNGDGKRRRNYPRVLPKYRNSSAPFETWSGRGKQPRWLVAAIKTGRKIDDFRIAAAGNSKGRRQA